jgi:DNA-binding NtrC family response regulator
MSATTSTDSIPVMVLDDDPIVLRSLSEYLRLEGYNVTSAQSLHEAMEYLDQRTFRVVLTDVRLPEGSGFDLLQHIRTKDLSAAVIMLTGYGTIEDAVRAIKTGAFDYVTKPISDEEVKLTIERALQQQALLEENKQLREQLNMSFHLDNMICRDPSMKKVLDMIRVVASTDTTVLITGESGTGKTLAARAIHANSPRADQPFVEVSCGTLPDTLLESELFGHMKGSFSGAIANKRGKFEAAHRGTLFLDEISIASASLQMKLLRVLESFKFEPVGSNDTREVDVRLILATNQDLGELAKKNEFREDLYYRVNVMNILLPPLRERRADIPPLANHFLNKYRNDALHGIDGISEQAMRLLQDHNYPGNVRELENLVRRAVVLCRSNSISAEDLPNTMVPAEETMMPKGEILPLKDAMRKWERKLIREGLRAAGGNRKETAEQLGINRTTLYNKMREYGISDA